jgi:hypothetical protein
MILAPLLAAIAAASAPEPVPGGHWKLCQTSFRMPGDVGALFSVDLDKAGLEETSVELDGDRFEAAWHPGPHILAGPDAMSSFIHFIDVPTDAIFPVSVVATVDGRVFWTGDFAEPDRSNGDGHGGVRRLLLVGKGPGNPFPNIFGIRTLSFVAADARGAIFARTRLDLPDWAQVERKTLSAMRRIDRMRRAARCPPLTLPV